MAAIINEIMNFYNSLMEKTDPRADSLPLLSSPWPVLALLVVYVKFVTSWGPAWMKDRPPFECKKAMILYNITQIGFNGLFTFEALRLIWIPMKYNLVCEEVDYSNEPFPLKVLFYTWLFFITKILDLLDTVFMVLRKKNNQISFLHVYHHTGMVAATWLATRFFAGGHGIFFGTVNSFVHTVMYSYYLLTALYPQYKNNIWWKRHITELQLAQFVITIIHAAAAFTKPDCQFPKLLLALFIPQDMFMFAMFWDFYKKSYLTPEKKVQNNYDWCLER